MVPENKEVRAKRHSWTSEKPVHNIDNKNNADWGLLLLL